MAKKTFKDSTSHLDRFFSDDEPEPAEQAYETHETPKTHGTQKTYKTQSQTLDKPDTKYYRFNLKMAVEYKEYLAHESWKAHKTVTAYINDLIQADMDSKDIRNT